MSDSWQKPTRRSTPSIFQRVQTLMLRLERIAVAKQAQRTQAVIHAIAAPEEKNRG